MRTETDVLLSVKRYFALCLGDAWEVREWSDEGSFSFPLAKVSEAGPALYTSKRVYTDIVLPVQVFCYQEPSDSVSASMRAARVVRETIIQAIEVGQVADPRVVTGWPRRIPLFDYAGLDPSQGSTVRNTYDFIKVTDLSVNTVQDSDVPTGVVVVADLRLAWRRDTTVDPGYETVESVGVNIGAS